MANYVEYLEYLKLQSHTVEAILKEKCMPIQRQIDELKTKLSNINREYENLSNELKDFFFIDPRDGRFYRTVRIGNQVWMAENLNYEAEDGKCYDNNKSEKYGKLYDWETAKKVCPPGWHLPSDAEWDTLMNAVGGEETEDKYLKAKSGWNENSNGLDTYGFAALPGGKADSLGYYGIGSDGCWWSATEYDANDAGYMCIYSSCCMDNIKKTYLLSVRCVKDSAP
jgi:uncharacterized protein (TIGR02145 family)